jgi:hypothetical protein
MLLGLLAGTAQAAPAQHDARAPVVWFTASAPPVGGAWSSLVTNASGASMTLHTNSLDAGHAVTIWWIIFNNVGACRSGIENGGGLRCGESDLFRTGVDASVLYATGHVVGNNGVGNFSAHLNTGDASGALFGPGLVNPLGADIHLIVHDHGPVDQSLMPAQIHSFDVCNGPCFDPQASAHEQ